MCSMMCTLMCTKYTSLMGVWQYIEKEMLCARNGDPDQSGYSQFYLRFHSSLKYRLSSYIPIGTWHLCNIPSTSMNVMTLIRCCLNVMCLLEYRPHANLHLSIWADFVDKPERDKHIPVYNVNQSRGSSPMGDQQKNWNFNIPTMCCVWPSLFSIFLLFCKILPFSSLSQPSLSHSFSGTQHSCKTESDRICVYWKNHSVDPIKTAPGAIWSLSFLSAILSERLGHDYVVKSTCSNFRINTAYV